MKTSRRSVLLLLLACTGAGCASFSELTPHGAYTEPQKGLWLAKTSTFLGMRFASQQVLFCYADNKARPVCTRAGGDVEAASVKQSVSKTEETQK